MKRVLLKTFLGMVVILAAAASVFAQNDDLGDPDEPEEKVPLVLTATVLNQKCFQGDKNLAELELRLQFTNNGGQPLILNKRDITITGMRFFAIIDEEKDEVHIGETTTCNLTGDLAEYDKELVSDYPNAHFVILLPGQSYAMEDRGVVPLIRSTASSGLTGNRADKYQVEIIVAALGASDSKLAGELQRKWQKVGALWSEVVRSEPIEFTFERNSRTCEK